MKLSGKVAVVTGASRGVGKAIALALGREGASVVVAARSEREVEEFPGTIYHTAEQIGKEGGTALPIKVDVTRAAEVDAMAQRVLSEFGRVDILINNAGVIGPTMSFLEIPIDLWDRIMRVNVRGLFLCTRALAPIMVRQGNGCIVNISSGAARRTGFLNIAYGASKAAVDRITLGLADELREHNVAAISLYPGFTITERLLRQASLENTSRAQSPEVSAKAVLYLVTGDPMQFSGQVVEAKDAAARYQP